MEFSVHNFKRTSLAVGLALILLLAGCNMPNQAETTPTLDTTQAYQTVQARLTEAVALTPTVTHTPEVTPTPSPTTTSTLAPATPTATTGAAATPSATTGGVASTCNQASPGTPIDVTIPDDTQLAPGQAFSKTWRLRNAGTCTWTSQYSIVYFSGDRMEAPASVPLSGDVAPGDTVDLTVDMIAPEQTGTFQSNWKLRTNSDQLFGIGPGEGLPFYVRIQVATNAPTTTPATSPTATQQTIVNATAILFPADRLDLDSAQVNSGGPDLDYIQDASDQALYLQPAESALAAIYGGFAPEQADCRAANLGSGRLNVADLTAGVYLCFRSNNGNIGWLRYTAFNADNNRLDLEVYTWISQ